MSILGILFRQKNVVIGAKEGSSVGALGTITGSLWKTVGGLTGIIIDAAVSLDHLRQSDVTEYPVEDGAKITDHVQLKPAQLTIQGVISDYPIGFAIIGNIANIVRTGTSLLNGSSRAIDAFNELEKLWKARQPFTVITGLKRYKNMVIEELSAPQTAQTGKALHFTAKMKEIRVVTSKTSSKPLSADAADSGSLTNDQGHQVTPTVDDPTSSAADAQKKVPTSLLYDATHAGG